MFKRDELTQSTSCLNKAQAMEPLFVLRAKDPIAPQTIRHWAAMAVGTHEVLKITEALMLAEQMEEWRAKMFPSQPAPPPLPTTSHPIPPSTIVEPTADLSKNYNA